MKHFDEDLNHGGEENSGGANEPCPGEDGDWEGGGYTPASFEKRTAAWMGIAYVLMILFVINFAIYTGGRQLPGTFPLFLIPVLTALSVIIVRRMRTGEALPGGMAGGALMLIACAGGIVLGLALGVPALLAAFGG